MKFCCYEICWKIVNFLQNSFVHYTSNTHKMPKIANISILKCNEMNLITQYLVHLQFYIVKLCVSKFFKSLSVALNETNNYVI